MKSSQQARKTTGASAPQPPSKLRAIENTLTSSILPLLLAGAILFLIPSTAPLTDGDTALYGTIALEMLRSGDWLTPTHPARGPDYILDKPPLTLWLMAVSFWLFGPTPFAARIWQILLSLGTLWLTVATGRLYLPRQTAIKAGWILLTTILFYYTGLVPQQDVATLFFMMLGFYGFLRFLLRGGLSWYYLIWIALAGGVLTRGISNLIMTGGVMAMFLLIDRPSLKGLFKSWGRVVVHLVGGLGLFILLAVPWFWAETKILGERFLEVFFFSGNMRYYEADHSPWVMLLGYTVLLFLAFLPWSGFIPHALTHGLKQAREGDGASRTRGSRFMLVWILFVFAFIHLIAWRVIRYLLPLLPPLALLVADLQERIGHGHKEETQVRVQRTVRWIITPILLVLGLLGTLVWFVPLPPETAVYRPIVTALGLPMGIGGVGLAVLARHGASPNKEQRRSSRLTVQLLSTGLATYLALGLCLLITGSAVFPQAEIAQRILDSAGESDAIVHLGESPVVFYDFYLFGRPVKWAQRGSYLPSGGEKVTWLITTQLQAELFRSATGVRVSEVYAGSTEVLLRIVRDD